MSDDFGTDVEFSEETCDWCAGLNPDCLNCDGTGVVAGDEDE